MGGKDQRRITVVLDLKKLRKGTSSNFLDFFMKQKVVGENTTGKKKYNIYIYISGQFIINP